MGYFPYTHIEPEIITISQLFQRPDLRESYFVNVSAKQLLDQTFLLGANQTLQVRNRDLIYRYYTREEKSKIKSAEEIDENSPIKLNTVFYVNEENISRDLLFSQTLNVEKTYSSNAFISQKLKDLMSNPDYVKSYTYNKVPNTVRKISPGVQVFIWCRSLANSETLSQVDIRSAQGIQFDDIPLSQYSKQGKSSPGTMDLEGQWIDVSPFIETLGINNAEGGGNFNFTLAPVVATYAKGTGWIFERFSVKNYTSGDLRNSFVAKSALHKYQKNELKRNQFLFNNLLAENDLVYIKLESLKVEEEDRVAISKKLNINSSDIVSQYDPLKKEITQERIYDMIGLIDTSSISYSAQNNDITIAIQGRDLVKTIIEDGSYFFPSEFAQGMFLSPGDADLNNSRLVRRLMFNGAIQNLGIYYEKTIQTVMQFILTQLSNTGFVPTSTFYAYRERRNTTLTLDTNFQRRQISERQSRIENHYSKISECIAKSRQWYRDDNLRIHLSRNAGINSATINDIRTMVIDFAQFLIDNDMVPDAGGSEEFSDYYLKNFTTWKKGVTFKTSFRKGFEIPSQVQLTLTSIYPRLFEGFLYPSGDFIFRTQLGKRADGVDIIYKEVFNAVTHAYAYLKLKSSPKDIPAKKQYLQGVWQIIDLLIDSSVRDRVLIDTSIAQEQGSLINTINKVCQKPLVEFFTDTYGDKFYFIIRKPPFDEKSVLGMVYGQNLSTEVTTQTEQPTIIQLLQGDTLINKDQIFKAQLEAADVKIGQYIALSTPPPSDVSTGIIIDIEESDLLADNLTWYSSEVYSWYRITPKGYLWGTSDEMTWAFLPAVYFEEYSDIWGNKPYIVAVNYLPLKPERESNSAFKQDPIIVQSYYDLKYIIDSNCYLPFTEQGSVSINGDRRIKRGIWVRLKGSGKIGYVDSVSHSYVGTNSTDRITTIQLSRVMVEKYIKPQTIEGIDQTVSYFNIINTSLKLSEKQTTEDIEVTIRTYVRSLNSKSPLDIRITQVSNRFGLNSDQSQKVLNNRLDDEIVAIAKNNVQNTDSPVDLRPETVLSNFGVNKQVFEFFVKRRQLDTSDD